MALDTVLSASTILVANNLLAFSHQGLLIIDTVLAPIGGIFIGVVSCGGSLLAARLAELLATVLGARVVLCPARRQPCPIDLVLVRCKAVGLSLFRGGADTLDDPELNQARNSLSDAILRKPAAVGQALAGPAADPAFHQKADADDRLPIRGVVLKAQDFAGDAVEHLVFLGREEVGEPVNVEVGALERMRVQYWVGQGDLPL